MEFVSLEDYGFVIEPRYYFFGWSKSSKILGRKSAVNKLVEARSYLPQGYNFKIWDCKRTIRVQLLMIESFKKRLKIMYPNLPNKERINLLWKFAGKPIRKVERLGVHRNGGSFDLTIINPKRDELYMGTDHDDLTERAKTDYFHKLKNPNLFDLEAKKNRDLLIKVMKKAEFINYKEEWWHWSYEK